MQHHSQDGAPACSMVTESQVLTSKCSSDAGCVVRRGPPLALPLACSPHGKQAVPSSRRGIAPAGTRNGGSARPPDPKGSAPWPHCETCPNEGFKAMFGTGASRRGAKGCALCADETPTGRVRERKTQGWTKNDEGQECLSYTKWGLPCHSGTLLYVFHVFQRAEIVNLQFSLRVEREHACSSSVG